MMQLRLLSLLLGIIIAGITSCTHTVYEDSVPLKNYRVFKRAVKDSCNAQSCDLGNCWKARSDLYMCDVLFEQVSFKNRKSVMTRALKNLSDKDYKIGFCGKNKEPVNKWVVSSLVLLSLSGRGIFIWGNQDDTDFGPIVGNDQRIFPNHTCFRERDEAQ